MGSSSSSFDEICKEVRSRFPSAFGSSAGDPLPAGCDLSAWVSSCPERTGLHQVMTVPGRVSGSLELLLDLVVETEKKGMRMVWIDPADCLDPATSFEGVPRHLLWARGGGLSTALRVADTVLRDENFPFVCLDGILLDADEWRRVPLNRWYRLQRLANRRGSCLVLWTPSVTIPAAIRRWTLSADWPFSRLFDCSREELRRGISLAAADASLAEGAG